MEDDADTIDIAAWVGKPPEKPKYMAQPAEYSDSEVSNEEASEKLASNHVVDDTTDVQNEVQQWPQDESGSEYDDDPEATSDLPRASFYIDIPRLTEEEKEQYEYLPGHFSVRKVLSQQRDKRYKVLLKSGESVIVSGRHNLVTVLLSCSARPLLLILAYHHHTSLVYSPHPLSDSTHFDCSLSLHGLLTMPAVQVSSRELRDLDNGRSSLLAFEDSDMPMSRQDRRIPRRVPDMVDPATISLSDSEDGLHEIPRRRGDMNDIVSELELTQESSEGEEDDASDEHHQTGRRSARLSGKRRLVDLKQELLDLDSDSDTRPRRRGRARTSILPSSRGTSYPKRKPRLRAASSPEDNGRLRRSERTRTKPRRSMRERQEDEISSYEEEKTGPKIISTKEYFARIPESDPFRRRHRQECDTCYFKGDDLVKGPLVFCQGCSNSYHKTCLGFRGTRDHLVTKVGENLFILQCRRCIGLAHEKDELAPHHGRCVGCNEFGELSKPFRSRLTTRQEQIQREENGGKDPITIVEPKLVSNVANVMFRCSQCDRAWHMHHLPDRKTAHSVEDEEDDILDETQLAQKRFDHYHRSWICKDCVENQGQIDALVAWRPIELDSYLPGTPVTEMREDEKEYLVKWRSQSYFRTTWMPGTWVWGIAPSTMRGAFAKKAENQLPKMSTADAIPEEAFRVDIVFDVRYSSVVRNRTKEIDLARAKEVDSAFVKYKGLGYEDAIWEKPPPYTDTERWNDFKAAYEDYVMKLHLSIPPQATLRRHLAQIRAQDLKTTLIKDKQPSNMTGGELMAYQLEGLNWLLFQWVKNQNAILADEMGLGKTIQLVAFFSTLVQDHKCWPFLVVVPNATCPNWRREVKKWAPSLRVVTYYGSSTSRKLTHDYELLPKDKDEDSPQQQKKKGSEAKDIKAHLVVASYESIIEEKTRKSLMRVPWQGLVVDEGQRLKSDRTQIYDILSKFRFPFKVLLTGTPLQNNARELFNLLQFLDKSMNASELEAKYNQLTQENVPELHEMLRKFFLRRTKAQVLTFLPPMAQIIVPVSMSTVQKKVYKSVLAKNPQLMRSIFARDGALQAKERLNLNNILMQLRKALCHPFVYSRDIEERSVESAVSYRNLVEASGKLQLLAIMLPKLQERGHRVLIFSQFLDNLDIIEDFLDGLGFQHRRLDGTITAAEKQKRIDEFNAPDSPYFAFLLSTRAGGVGINLATADTVIILDPDFNPHQDIQALSRAHRIGQKHKVLVFQLMTRDTVEEKIMQIGRKKMALDHVLIERMDKDDDVGEDLESILRHGAQALFEEDAATQDIVYDSSSVDLLLDRSQIENTKTSEEKSAESQFSFARIWANDRSTLEDDLPDRTGNSTPNPGIWDKILQERERIFAEEQALEAKTFGRGKRKRQVSRKVEKDMDMTMTCAERRLRGR